MFEGWGSARDGESRYLPKGKSVKGLPPGTILTSVNGKNGFFRGKVDVVATPPPRQHLPGPSVISLPKDLWRPLPPNFRDNQQVSAAEKLRLRDLDPPSRREELIRRIADRMTDARAEALRAAVIEALKDEGDPTKCLPPNPYREDDLPSDAIIVTIAADAKLAMDEDRIVFPSNSLSFNSFTQPSVLALKSDDGKFDARRFAGSDNRDYVEIIRKAVLQYVNLRDTEDDRLDDVKSS